MNEQKAREILASIADIENSVIGIGWVADKDSLEIYPSYASAYFTAEQLEAIAWWMGHKGEKE